MSTKSDALEERNRAANAAHESLSAQQNTPDVSWIIAARICVLSVALLSSSFATFLYGEESAARVQFLFVPIAVLYGLSALSALWLKYLRYGNGFVLSQLVLDAAILTGIVYVTGGPASPFLFLYLPVVMSASIFISRTIALFTALVCSAAYSALAWAMFHGYLHPADGSPVVPVPAGGLFLQCVGLSSAMVLMAIATSFLTRRMRSGFLLAEESNRILSRLSHEQESLFQGLPEGVVITEADGTVTSVNTSAAHLLGLDRQRSVGKRLEDAILSSTASCDLEGELCGSGELGEFSLRQSENAEDIRVQYRCREMNDESGVSYGRMFLFHDVTKLRSIEEQLAVQERMARLLAGDHSEPIGSSSMLDEFVGESTVMKKVFGLIERVAPSNATVLISGESGTGKELVARAIHLGGPRASRPFVPVNCGAIPETLIESELFGHKKGSFTGADSDKIGLFRRADRGTVFLDEIGELPLLTQAKLLRALQEKCVRPVGSENSIPIDVRIIAASNRNLREEVKKENFREDLYYRLDVIHVQLPSLRERKEDIPLLVNSILKRQVDRDTTPVVAPAVMQKLMMHDYPGNVRELENILERACVFGGEAILPEHLPDFLKQETPKNGSPQRKETTIIEMDNIDFPLKLDEMLADLEKRYIVGALTKSGGVKKHAAELLGMNFRSFRYRLQKFGIDAE